MTVKVSARLTKEEASYNGLDAIREKLVDQPHGRRYAVVAFDVLRTTTEIEEGIVVPTVKLAHIEPLEGDDADTARKLLESTYRERTGKDPQMELDFGVGGPDGERGVPEPSGEELLAERREARERAAGGGDA